MVSDSFRSKVDDLKWSIINAGRSMKSGEVGRDSTRTVATSMYNTDKHGMLTWLRSYDANTVLMSLRGVSQSNTIYSANAPEAGTSIQ